MFYNSRVPVSKHGKVIPFDVQKCQDDILPTILKYELDPSLETISVDCVQAIDQGKSDVIPQSLESRDGEVLFRKERRKCVCGRKAKGKDLPVLAHISASDTAPMGKTGNFCCVVPKQKDKIEVFRLQVGKPVSVAPLDRVCVLRSPFALGSLAETNDLRRSVHGIRAARGQFFGVVRDGMGVFNG